MSNIEEQIDEIFNELSFNGINDISYCPGGHKLEKYAREQAKKQLLNLIIDERIDELNTILQNNYDDMHRTYDVKGIGGDVFERIQKLENSKEGQE